MAPFAKGSFSSGSGPGLDICELLGEVMGIERTVRGGTGNGRGAHVCLAVPRS